MTFKSTFKALKPDNFAFYLLQVTSFERWIAYFPISFCLSFASKREGFLDAVFEFVYVISNSIPIKNLLSFLLYSYHFFWSPTPLGLTALVQCATLWAFSRHEINDPSLDPGKYYCLLRLCVGDTVEKYVKNVQKPIFTLKYISKYKSFCHNVCFIKNCSKLSSVLLLCLLRIFMKQTLKA